MTEKKVLALCSRCIACVGLLSTLIELLSKMFDLELVQHDCKMFFSLVYIQQAINANEH